MEGPMGDARQYRVPSIGEKTATSINAQYKSIENAYVYLEELKLSPPSVRKFGRSITFR